MSEELIVHMKHIKNFMGNNCLKRGILTIYNEKLVMINNSSYRRREIL